MTTLRKTKFMKDLLVAGKRSIPHQSRKIVDGYYIQIFDRKTKSNWRYQINYVHDTRDHPKPYVSVYAYSPKKPFEASYFLRSFD